MVVQHSFFLEIGRIWNTIYHMQMVVVEMESEDFSKQKFLESFTFT